MRGNVYQIIAIETQIAKKGEKTELSKIVLGPITVIAMNEQAAATKALLTEETLRGCNPDTLELVVRPF